MTKEDLPKARQALARLRDDLPGLLEVAFQRSPLLKAYPDSKPRTCGDPSCRCARGERHPAWVFRIPQGRKSISRSVPETVFRKLEPLAKDYQAFRQAVAHWRRLVQEADQALREIEAARLVDLEARLKNGE